MYKLLLPLMVLLLPLVGCVGLGDSAGYIKKNGGVTTAHTLKNVTVKGNLTFQGSPSESKASQGGALSPEDSLNGNSLDPKVPLEVPELPPLPEKLSEPFVGPLALDPTRVSD